LYYLWRGRKKEVLDLVATLLDLASHVIGPPLYIDLVPRSSTFKKESKLLKYNYIKLSIYIIRIKRKKKL
jgi:hypothetical protein